MKVYYVELQKATVLEKKFIYTTCWLFGMALHFWSAPNVNTPPSSSSSLLLPPSSLTSVLLFLSAPDPAGLQREPRVWHRRRTPTSCPTRCPDSCPPAWSLPQVMVWCVFTALWPCWGFLFNHTHTHTLSGLPVTGLPAARPPNGNQSKVTHAPNHQTPTAHSFTKKRSSAQAPETKTGENKLDWRSFALRLFH